MLRKIRLTFAMICFVLITLLFLDFTGTLHGWFGWLAKIQFLPAVLALNVGVILFLVILTLVCGRIYCSVICPLGVFQDILAWLGRQPKKRRKLPYSKSTVSLYEQLAYTCCNYIANPKISIHKQPQLLTAKVRFLFINKEM